MSHSSPFVDASEPLSVALDIFKKTRFGFVPITIEDRVATSLSIRDILRVLTGKIVTPVGEVSSRLVSVRYNTSIEKALELMLEKGIRNLNVRNENNDDIGIINDRKILEFLLSYEGRGVMAGPMGLDAVSVIFLIWQHQSISNKVYQLASQLNSYLMSAHHAFYCRIIAL